MSRETSRITHATLLAIVAGAFSGCGPSGPPATSSPITTPESEAGRKAIADDERLIQERRAQEARAHKRIKGLPTEG